MRKRPPSEYDIDRLPPEIFSGIGSIIAWWGYLQFQLGVIIREVTNLGKDTGYVLTIGADLGALCGMIKALTHSNHWIKDESIRKDLEKLGKNVRGKAKVRNNYAHGVFGYDKKNPNVFVRHLFSCPAHKITPGTERLTPKSLKFVSDEARDLWYQAQDITHRLKALRRTRS